MTKKDKKRLLQIITLSVIALSIVLIAVPYVKQYKKYNRQIANYEEKLIQAYQRQLNKPLLEQEIGRAEGLLDQGAMFIIADTQEQADAQLSQFMRKIIAEANGEVERTKKTSGQGTAVSLDTRFTSSTESFVEILRAISEHRPVINVTSVIISPITDKKRVKDGKRTKVIRELNGNLKVTLTVESFFTTADAEPVVAANIGGSVQ